MRLLVLTSVLCLLAGTVACLECSVCDSACEEACEESCAWPTYNSHYYCDYDRVSCKCSVRPVVWAAASVVFLGVLAACCCGPPAAVVAHYWATDEKAALERPTPGSLRLFSALSPPLYRVAVAWLQVVSCTLCRPLLLLESARMTLRRVDVDGTRLTLHAEWADYCKLVWLPTCALNCLSCGLYTCCGFAEQREDEFLDARTSVEGKSGEPVVFFRAKANWWYRWMAAVLTAWSCGLAYSFLYVELVARSLGLMDLAGVAVASSMEASAFFADVWLWTCVFDCLSCHLYSCCGFAHRRQAEYTDERLTMPIFHAEAIELGHPTDDCDALLMGEEPSISDTQRLSPSGEAMED